MWRLLSAVIDRNLLCIKLNVNPATDFFLLFLLQVIYLRLSGRRWLPFFTPFCRGTLQIYRCLSILLVLGSLPLHWPLLSMQQTRWDANKDALISWMGRLEGLDLWPLLGVDEHLIKWEILCPHYAERRARALPRSAWIFRGAGLRDITYGFYDLWSVLYAEPDFIFLFGVS